MTFQTVSKEQVLKYSPMLADKLALTTEILSIQEIAKKLCKILTRP